MIFLSLFVCVFFYFWTISEDNVLYDPLTLHFIGLLYYGFMIPIFITITENYYIIFLDNEISVSRDEVDSIAYALGVGYISFLLGYRMVTPRHFVGSMLERAKAARLETTDNSGTILAATVIACAIACVLFFSDQLLSVFSGYEGKIETRYEASTFALLYNFTLLVGASLMAFNIIFNRNYLRDGIIFTAFMFIWAFFTFSKEPMIFGALTIFATAVRAAPKYQTLALVGAVIVAILLLLFLIPAFSFYRATGVLSLVDLGQVSVSFLFSDANGPFSTLALAVKQGQSIQLGPLVESFFLWIPRGIWPERPLDAAEEFARAVMTGWRPGYGLGFSPFAEGVLRFGFLSPILLFIAGFTVSFMQKITTRLLSPSLVPPLLLIVQSYILFSSHRGAFSGIFTAIFQFWMPFLLVTSIIQAFLTWQSSQHRLQSPDGN